MSTWGDICRRAEGKEIRREDKIKNKLDKIGEMLKSMKVSPYGYSPIFQFLIFVHEFDDQIIMYHLIGTATMHEDGTKDFYSEELLNSFKRIEENGEIIKINDSFSNLSLLEL